MGDRALGRYTGELILEPLQGGQLMKTVLDFGFLGADGRHWPVPPATFVDGSSIPEPLWPLMGGLWQGECREAFVVHDHYCTARSADWRSVRRMFYNAMLVCGVSEDRAKLVYAGAYFAGPRWEDMVVEPVRPGERTAPAQTAAGDILYAICRDPVALAVSEAIECEGTSAFDRITSKRPPADSNSAITLGLDKLADMVQEDAPSLRSLEAAIDYAVALIPNVEGFPRKISVGRLEHDPEKWKPVFRKDHAQTKG
jgi:Protein of unknown function (DUF1353)